MGGLQVRVLEVFSTMRNVIGICPRSQQFFRLSECRLVHRCSHTDWLDHLTSDQVRLERAEERLANQEYKLREKAREHGRRIATAMARRVDRVFTPRRLNPDDVRAVLDPIDFIAFKGMSANSIKGICLLDRMSKANRTVQRSIEKCVEQEKYEWLTLRISDAGEISTE